MPQDFFGGGKLYLGGEMAFERARGGDNLARIDLCFDCRALWERGWNENVPTRPLFINTWIKADRCHAMPNGSFVLRAGQPGPVFGSVGCACEPTLARVPEAWQLKVWLVSRIR